jgi:predicted Rossmann fold nucleotide-binding protein DprA/Smf involved in DNA uptake
MTVSEDILNSIENRLREVHEEIAALTAARSALNGAETAATSSSPARRSAPRRSTQPRRRSRTRRSTQVVPAEKLELLLSQSEGLTTTQLAEQTGGRRDQVINLLRELEAAGRIRRSGQRRGTRWHAINEEAWIAERAQELASRGNSRA